MSLWRALCRLLSVPLILTGLSFVATVAGPVASAQADVTTGTGGQFVPLSATLLDTRNHQTSGFNSPMQTNTWVALPVAGQVGIPSTGVSAVQITVTAVNPTQTGIVNLRPHLGSSTYTALYYDGGVSGTVTNTAIEALSGNGLIDVKVSGSTDLIIGVQGYYTAGDPSASGYVPSSAPARVATTLGGTGGLPNHQFPANATGTVTIAGSAGVPAGASAVFVNFEAINRSANPGYLLANAAGGTTSQASLNFPGGVNLTTSLGAIVPLSSDGKIDVKYVASSGSTIDLNVDVVGYFAPASSQIAGGEQGAFTPAQTRVINAVTIPGSSTTTFYVAGTNGVPAVGNGIEALATNLQVVHSGTAAGWVEAYADNQTASAGDVVMNLANGSTRSNMATIALGPDGGIKITNGSTDSLKIYLDVEGWYTSLKNQLVVGGQNITQKNIQLQAQPQGSTPVTYQYRVGTTGSFSNIATSMLTDGSGNHPASWPISPSGTPATFTAYNWDVADSAGVTGNQDALVQVQACYGTTSPACAMPNDITVTAANFSDSDATAGVGPASLSLLSGDYQVSSTDAAAATSVGGLSVGRTLTTLAPAPANSTASGVFGPGWTADLTGPGAGDANLTPVTVVPGGGYVLFRGSFAGVAEYPLVGDPNAASTTYTATGDPAVEGRVVTLSNSGNTLTMGDPDGTVTTWTKSGTSWNLASVDEPGSNTTHTYSYNAAGLVTRILGPVPKGVSCSSPDTTPGCRSLVLNYGTGSLSNRLVEIDASLPQTSGTANQIPVAHYDYNAAGQLADVYDPRITPHLVIGYTYDANDRLATLTPPGQNPWSFVYDGMGRLSTVSRTVPVTDPTSGTVSNQTSTSTVIYNVPLSGGGLPDLTAASTATWDETNDLPVAGSATAIFPPDHTPTGTTVATASSSDWPYATIHYLDANGREVNTATYGSGQFLIDTTQYDANGNDVWDLSAGNRAQALSPSSSTDPYVAGQSSTAARADLLSSATIYNPVNPAEVTETFGPAHPVELTTGATIDAREHAQTMYDDGAPNNDVNAAGTAYGLPTEVVTDPYNVQTNTDPASQGDVRTQLYGYAAVGGMTTTGWDLGQATTSTVQVGANPSSSDLTTTTIYDDSGRETAIWLPGDSTGTTARTRDTAYYTATGSGPCVSAAQAGLVCQVSPGGQPATGAPLPTTTTTYNQWGDPLTIVQAFGSSTTRTVTNTYDGTGRLRTSTVAVSGAPADNSPLPPVSDAYDPTTGALATSAAGSQTLSQTVDATGSLATYTDATGARTTYGYDIDGRTVWRADTRGQVSWSYDSDPRGLVTGESFDPTGTMSGTPSSFGVSYDASGHATTTYPNGLVASGTWDNAGNQTSLTYAKSGSTWYTDTNTVGAQDRTIAATSAVNGVAYSTQTYGFDGAGRLQVVQDNLLASGTGSPTGCTTRTYGFDTHGNRISLVSNAPGTGGTCSTGSTAVTNGYNYDGADRLTSDTSGGSGYVYDAMGRASTVPSGDAKGTASHSATTGDAIVGYYSNDIVATQSQGSTSIAFTLDPGQNRIGTQTETNADGTTTVTNHYDDGSDSPTWTSTVNPDSSTSWSRNVTGPNGGLAIVIGSAGSVTLQLVNLHGDIVSTVPDAANSNATSFAATYMETDEYGVPRSASTAITPYGYLGSKERSNNDLAGFTLMGARLYSAATGRFLSPDPVYGGNENAYNYPNDPVDNSDSTGSNTRDPGNIGGPGILTPAGGSGGPPEGGNPGDGNQHPVAPPVGSGWVQGPVFGKGISSAGLDEISKILDECAGNDKGLPRGPQQERIAKLLGFVRTNYRSRANMTIYMSARSKLFISFDRTSHKGQPSWKVARSWQDLQGTKRVGTWDILLETKIGK